MYQEVLVIAVADVDRVVGGRKGWTERDRIRHRNKRHSSGVAIMVVRHKLLAPDDQIAQEGDRRQYSANQAVREAQHGLKLAAGHARSRGRPRHPPGRMG